MPYRLWYDSTIFIRHKFGSFLVARTHHCVRLAAACLSVREHSAVVATQDTLNKAEASFVVYFLLLRILTVNRVEGERPALVHLAVLRPLQNDLAVLSVDQDNILAAFALINWLTTYPLRARFCS